MGREENRAKRALEKNPIEAFHTLQKNMKIFPRKNKQGMPNISMR